MAQPPLQQDVLEIVGDSGTGTRLIESTATTGELLLSDAVVTSKKTLAEIFGLQSVSGVVIVGKGGEGVSKDALGSPITTIQAAQDAVPTSASVSSPWLILVMPGLYIEDVFFDRDGVHMFGLGNVVIRNSTATNTFTVLEGPFSIPKRLTLQNLRIENTDVSSACVELTSALYATGTNTVSGVVFVGDTFSIGGNTLTAIATGSTPVAGEFELGASFTDTATNLVTASNSALNPAINALVKATSLAAVVTLQSQVPGLGGNATTMATSVPATFVLSGATLAGGVDSAAGSTVGNDSLRFINCDLVAAGVTGFHLFAESINNIYVSGGNWGGSSTGAALRIRECASLEMVDTSNISLLVLRYDTVGGGPIPSIATSSYTLRNLSVASTTTAAFDGGTGSLTVSGGTYIGLLTFTGTGGETLTSSNVSNGAMSVSGVAAVVNLYDFDANSLAVSGSPVLACGPGLVRATIADSTTGTSVYTNMGAATITCTAGGTWSFINTSCSGTLSGDSGSLTLQNSSAATLTLAGTCACVSRNSRWVTITPSGAGPTLDIDELQFTVSFAGVSSVVVPFLVEQSDALYHVYLDSPIVPAVSTDIPAVPTRVVASFTITYGAPQATTVGATVRRFP